MVRHLIVDPTENADRLRAELNEMDPAAETLIVADGETAASVAREAPPDVVWMELVLPLRPGDTTDPILTRITNNHQVAPGPNNGLLVARRLRALLPDATFVVCTRLNLAHPDVRRALQEGADCAISQPVRGLAVQEALAAFGLLPAAVVVLAEPAPEAVPAPRARERAAPADRCPSLGLQAPAKYSTPSSQ